MTTSTLTPIYDGGSEIGLGWAAGREIYHGERPESGPDDTEGAPSHEEIDALARKIVAEKRRMERVLDKTPEFEDRPKQTVSTTELINDVKNR